MAIYSGGTIVADATNLNSPRLTGALPAISGASLTGIATGKVLQVTYGNKVSTETTTNLASAGNWADVISEYPCCMDGFPKYDFGSNIQSAICC